LNRTTALFVALAILLGHALAIHKTAAGEIAPPYDMAYAAFRIARNFVQSGEFAWSSGTIGIESYPSLLWILLMSLAERFYWSVNQAAQSIGMVSALLCVLTLAQFSPGRLAGVIAPLLFVVSGSIAAAALSGMETATVALLVTFSFLAYERGWRVALAVSLSLTAISRPQGLLFVLVLLAVEAVRRLVALRRPPKTPRASLWISFAGPVVLAAAMAYIRHQATGHWTSTWISQLFEARPKVVGEGLQYVRDFFVSSGGGLLFVFPLWYLARGSLSGVGIRACVLTVAWIVGEIFAGGGSLPYSEAMTPILAVLLVAVQEAMQLALDSRRRGWPQVSWVLFLLGLSASALASKFPGDLGPIPFEALHRQWMTPHTVARFGYREDLGRLGLAEEILATERLREIGLFLRDNIDANHTVLSPWPGAIGYLSRRQVIDPLGRTSPSPGEARTRVWEGMPRADIAKALSLSPDYVIPSLAFGEAAPSAQDIAQEWTKSLDLLKDKQQRALNLKSRMADYELITVPVVGSGSRAGIFPRNYFRFLRRVSLGLAPRVFIESDGERLRVEVGHAAYPQLVDLRVQARDASGAKWTLRPTGEWVKAPNALARTSIMLFHTGERRIRLIETAPPPGDGSWEVRAVLRNPGASGESLFSSVSSDALLRIPPR